MISPEKDLICPTSKETKEKLADVTHFVLNADIPFSKYTVLFLVAPINTQKLHHRGLSPKRMTAMCATKRAIVRTDRWILVARLLGSGNLEFVTRRQEVL